MVRFTRARTHVCIQFKGTGIILAHTSDMADLGTYYCDIYRGHGNTQGMCGVRKQLHTAGGTKHMAALSDGFE